MNHLLPKLGANSGMPQRETKRRGVSGPADGRDSQPSEHSADATWRVDNGNSIDFSSADPRALHSKFARSSSTDSRITDPRPTDSKLTDSSSSGSSSRAAFQSSAELNSSRVSHSPICLNLGKKAERGPSPGVAPEIKPNNNKLFNFLWSKAGKAGKANKRLFTTKYTKTRRQGVLVPWALTCLFALSIPWALGMGQKLPLAFLQPLGAKLKPAHQQQPWSSGPLSRAQAAQRRLDRDGDGLPDQLEDALLERYSPTVVLAADEPSYPASISWLRERIDIGSSTSGWGLLAPAKAFDRETRQGSQDPRDWVMYGHAFPLEQGGVALQYWFWYPRNDGPLFFDHDGDWEHVSVFLDRELRPVEVALAQHENNAPGLRVPWDQLAREDSHPIVLSARGTHASYSRSDQAPLWERLAHCETDEAGLPILATCNGSVWRAGTENGRESPVLNVGERQAPRLDEDPDGFFMRYAGLWGVHASFLGTAAPPGPPFQRGFCVGAKKGVCQ